MSDTNRSSFVEPDSRRGSLAFFRFLLTFEYVFESTGHYGWFQCLVLVLTSIIECSIGLTLFTVLTEGLTFGWTWSCNTPVGGISNLNQTGDQWDRRDWCPIPGDDCTNLTFLGETTTVATEWHLICEDQHLVRLTTVLFFAGSLGGSVINGQLADAFGRRKMTLLFWTLMMILQALTGVSTSWIMYLTVRICAGICVGACTASNSVIAAEYMGSKGRVLAAQKFGRSLSLLLMSLFLYFIKNWRHRAFATGLLWAPSAIALFIFLPESARWLLQKDRTAEAEAIVKKIAKYNRRSLPNLTFLTRIAETHKEERKGHDLYTYFDLFASRKYAVRTLSLLFIWFAKIVVMTGLENRITELNIALKLTVLGATMFIGKGISLYLANRFGRKKSFIANVLVVMTITLCMLTVDVLDLYFGVDYKLIILTTLALVSLIAMTGLNMLAFCFVMETYPTLLRSTANGVANTFGEIGGIIAFYVPLLDVYHISIPYVIIFILAGISTILVRVVMPETRDRDLLEELPQGEQDGCCTGRCNRKCWCSAGSSDGITYEPEGEHKRDYNRDYVVLDFTQKRTSETPC
ncbi:solute carrier family 22 member 15-like [Lineus longissimus]|uniref:solute carrier family 22 member 15-like n=1 Tax=Lineus longissimus TaxID=88925 RepID=UPI002B4C31A5